MSRPAPSPVCPACFGDPRRCDCTPTERAWDAAVDRLAADRLTAPRARRVVDVRSERDDLTDLDAAHAERLRFDLRATYYAAIATNDTDGAASASPGARRDARRGGGRRGRRDPLDGARAVTRLDHDPAHALALLLAESPHDAKASAALDQTTARVRARLAAVGLLRACVLCGKDHTPATPIARTPDPVLVAAPAHPAHRRVLARGHWTCTPCYGATVTL